MLNESSKLTRVSVSVTDLDDADFGETRDLPLFSFLQPGEIGAWPLLQLGPFDEPYTSLEHLMGTLAAIQVHSFVDVYVAQDERNSSQYILQVFAQRASSMRANFKNGRPAQQRRTISISGRLIERFRA